MNTAAPLAPIDISFLADLESQNIDRLITWCAREIANPEGEDSSKITGLLDWEAAYEGYLLGQRVDVVLSPPFTVAHFTELLSLLKLAGAPALYQALVHGQRRLHFAHKCFGADLGL